MSLITDKNNIFLVSPETQHHTSKNFSSFMEEDFTIFIRARIVSEDFNVGDQGFLISRNGKHAGISVIKSESCFHIKFGYWFSNENDDNIYELLNYDLSVESAIEFNDYKMICNHTEKTIDCYINDILIGSIDYKGNIKHSYSDSFMWFGCGSMIIDSDYRDIGYFEYSLFFCLDKSLSGNEINELKNTYKNKIELLYGGLPILDNNIPNRNNILFFLDFENKTKYKLWNLVFNGLYPQLYIENNIYF